MQYRTLGQGEFGVVKLVHDVKTKDLVESKPLAVKYLKKGYTFRDNTLYTPMKKEVLQGEVEILRRLNGECFNLKVRLMQIGAEDINARDISCSNTVLLHISIFTARGSLRNSLNNPHGDRILRRWRNDSLRYKGFQFSRWITYRRC
jgi:serine/threonine protein kinase